MGVGNSYNLYVTVLYISLILIFQSLLCLFPSKGNYELNTKTSDILRHNFAPIDTYVQQKSLSSIVFKEIIFLICLKKVNFEFS